MSHRPPVKRLELMYSVRRGFIDYYRVRGA